MPGEVKTYKFSGKTDLVFLGVFCSIIAILCCGLWVLAFLGSLDVAWRWSNVDRSVIAVSESDFQVTSFLLSES